MKRGRKSKYDIEINKSKVWNVAVYIRLSVQDGDKAEVFEDIYKENGLTFSRLRIRGSEEKKC